MYGILSKSVKIFLYQEKAEKFFLHVNRFLNDSSVNNRQTFYKEGKAVKKKFCSLCVFILLFLCYSVSGADYITPNDSSTYTLSDIETLCLGTTISGGPTSFTLSGKLTIAPNATLQIQAGEKLLAETSPDSIGHAIVVQGAIQVNGTSGNRALLGSHDEKPGDWRGIFLRSDLSRTNSIEYADIEYASTGISVMGGAANNIRHCILTQCHYTGVHVAPGYNANIEYNQINPWFFGSGVTIDAASGALVTTNTITGGAVGFSSSSSDASTLILDNQTSCSLSGLASLGNDLAAFEGNLVKWGFLGSTVYNQASSDFFGNEFQGQYSSGVAIVNNASPKFRDNNFLNSVSLGGVFFDDEAAPDLGGEYDPGLNLFSGNQNWDIVNFTPADHYVLGNDWSVEPPDSVSYDDEEDAGDADGNGVTSGRIITSLATVAQWMLY